MRCFYYCLLCLISLAAGADQAAYVSEEMAEKAAKLLPKGTEVRHFCEPCHDGEPRPETVESATVKYTGNDKFYELHVNGAPVDLAYVFVPVEGVFTNLAWHLGLEVQDVSLVLGEGETYDEEGGMPKPSDIPRLHLMGKIGDKGVLMELTRMEQGLYGNYQYLHIGEPITLDGKLEAEGKATISELVGEDKTGQFIGQFSEDVKTFTGKWVNPDGTKSLDFALERAAVSALEENNITTPGAKSISVLEYPVFTAGAGAENLTKFFQDYVQDRHRAHVREVVATAAADMQIEVPEDNPMLAQSLDLNGYQFSYYDGVFLSLFLSEFAFAGGAHGNSASHTINLRIAKDGKLKLVALKELFTDADAALALLSFRLLAELKAQEAQWVVDGQTKELGWDDLAAWTLDGRGFTVYFDPYAMGPYAQGMFVVTVPLKTVAEVLNPEALPAALQAALAR